MEKVDFVIPRGKWQDLQAGSRERAENLFSTTVTISNDGDENGEWVTVTGEELMVKRTKSYICSICDPEVEEAVTYPIAIHDYLSADVRDRIEFTSCAVMYMIDGMALLRGTSMSVTKAVSILESTILTAGTDRAANTALHVQPREFNIDEELSRLASRQNSDMGEEGLCSLPESVKYHLLEQMAKEMTGDSVQLAAAADSTLDFSLENHASDESSPDPSLKAASSSLADSSASAIAVALEAVEVPTTTTESNTPLTKPSSALAYNFTNPPKKSGLACNFTNPPKKSGLACNFTNPPKKSGLACNFTNPPKKSGLACNFTNPPTKSGLACNFSNPPKKSVVVCNSDNTPKDTSASPSLLSSQPSPLPEAASSSVSVDVAVPIVAAAPLNTPAPIVTAGSSRRSLWSDPVVESLPAVSSHIPFPAVHTESAISSSDTSGTQPFPKSDSGYPEVPHISKATMPAVFSSHSSHTSADVDSRIRKPDDTVSQATLDTSEESDRLAGYPEHIREADRKERERKKHQEQLGLASQKQGRPSDGGYQPHSRPIQNLPGHRQKHQPSPQHGRPPQYSHSPQRGIPPHSPAAIPGSHTSHPAGQHHRGNQRLQGYRTIFRSVSGVPGTPRPIVIDGSNVARSHYPGGTVFSCKAIQIVVDYFLQRGHTSVSALIPQHRLERYQHDCRITDQNILHDLKSKSRLFLTPARRIDGRLVACYDDLTILQYASQHGGIVVSNDQYRDVYSKHAEFQDVIRNHRLPFTFIGDDFMPPYDPLGRHGPALADFLTF